MKSSALLIVVSILSSCKSPPTPAHDASVQDSIIGDIPALMPVITSDPCVTEARDFGAVPDDGLDDTAGLRAAAASACPNVRLEAGDYSMAVQSYPRAVSMVDMKGVLSGAGQDVTTIRLTGSGSDQDLFAVRLIASGSGAQDLTVDMTGLIPGTTNEQTHAFAVDGRIAKVSGIRITRVKILNPYGDCADLVGYEPEPDGTKDFRISVRVDHSIFQVCGRSGITFFGGCNDCEFDHLTGINVYDQIFDGEGKGGGSHRVKIHHNFDRAGSSIESTLAIDVNNSSEIEIFDNDFDRGISLARCFACSVRDTKIVQSSVSEPLISITKEGEITLSDLRLTREASASPGVLVYGGWRSGTVPTSIALSDSTLIQKTDAPAIDGYGIRSLAIHRTDFQFVGDSAGLRDAITVSGGPVSSGLKASISVSDSTISGSVRSATFLSGAYAGMTTATFRKLTAPEGLRCKNVAVTTKNGGIQGPLIVDQCPWPAWTCPGL